MIHDPLCADADGPCCPWMTDGCDCQCMCHLITKVRADEREKAAQRINNAHQKRRIRSVNRAIAAARGEAS